MRTRFVFAKGEKRNIDVQTGKRRCVPLSRGQRFIF
jgi:hypothetical protein